MSLEKNPFFVLSLSESNVRDETKHFYEFKSFRLDVEERQLLDDNSPVPLTPKSFDVLALLVENRGHLVKKEEILDVIWANSFVEEQNITRTIHTLRKVLGDDGNGNRFIETVAKKGYRFVAEVTETGEKKTSESAGTPDVSNLIESKNETEFRVPISATAETASASAIQPFPRGRNILFAVGFLSAVFLIFALSFNFNHESSPGGKQTKSVAVLPLKPINAANRDDVYEIGIADSLIYRMGTMKGIIVRPLGATRKYADVAQDPLVAGKEQQADYVLAANYQIADGKIRITAQLFNVESGKIEETYKTEKDTGNVFALQDTIAGEIGNLLQTRFALTPNTTTARRGTTNEEAYRLYLQGKNLTMRRNKEWQKKSIECFEQAIKLDPNYALAYARMAFAYYFGSINQNSAANAGKVKEIVNKALELDPNLAEAYVSRGFVSGVYDWDFRASEKDYLRAIELEPNNDTAHWLYAMLLSNRGRSDEALAEIETALTIDPGATMYMEHRGRILYYARRYDEAIAQFQQVIDLDDQMNQPYAGLSRVYEIKGDYAAAYQFFLKREERSPRKDRLEIYQKVYETAGWIGVRRELAESLEYNFFDLARLYALQGEKDAAFESLNKSVEKREWFIVTLNVEPAFDSLRDDPRFDELLRRVGFK
jgi:DNA-binding winged helix-turn-helix (wHTH) protein/tetratricopeptide (TPR) repeat protein/TolB-like protein